MGHHEAGKPDVSLAATGYVLDQTPELPDVEAATRRALLAGEPPPLGPYRTYYLIEVGGKVLGHLTIPRGAVPCDFFVYDAEI